MTPSLFILGVGDNTAVLIDIVEACGYSVAGLYHYNDDKRDSSFMGFPIVGSYADLWSQPHLRGQQFALSMGDNSIRHELGLKLRAMGGETPILVHPRAYVSRYATLAEGVIIYAHATVDPNVTIGEDSMISSHCLLCHNTTLEPACFIGAGVTVGAHVHIKHGAFVGLQAVLISKKVSSIGTFAYIGAGAVVSKDVAAYDLVAGVPARSIKKG